MKPVFVPIFSILPPNLCLQSDRELNENRIVPNKAQHRCLDAET